MKKIRHIFIIPLCALLFTMCSEPELIEGDTLELSKEGIIELANTPVQMVIEVKTNKSDWTFIKKGDWLTVKQNPNQLLIEAHNNEGSESRSAEILVLSGRVSKKIEIVQQGGKSNFTLSQEKVTISNWGDSFSLDVSTNAKNWKARTDADWVQLIPIYQTGKLDVSVAENTDHEERIAKIYLTTDEFVEKEFTIYQVGKKYYLLPSLDFLTNNLSIREFEFARGSVLNSVPNGLINLNKWVFGTDSDVFSSVVYTIFNDAPNSDVDSDLEFYKQSTVYASNPTLFQDKRELQGLKRYLESQGFIWDDEFQWYYNFEKYVVAEIKITGSSSTISFRYLPPQPSAYKTLESLPFTNLSLTNKDEMLEWEAKNGGVLNTEISKLDPEASKNHYWFDLNDGGELKGRLYVVSTNTEKIDFRNYQYKNLSLALYDHSNTVFLTKEFMSLMKKEGFVYEEEFEHGVFRFTSIEKKIHVFVHLNSFGLVLQVEPL